VSTAAFLLGLERNGGHLFSVDIDPTCANIYTHPLWTFILGNSQTQVEEIKQRVGGNVDVLFIDGDHSYEAVAADLENYGSIVKERGLIILHDVEPSEEYLPLIIENNWFPHADPRRAYDEFLYRHPAWPNKIMPGHFGLGVIKKEPL
jgi:predicted O-methyltransferase YrrM